MISWLIELSLRNRFMVIALFLLVGDRALVYVPIEGEEAKFTERRVKLGAAVGDMVEVLEGLKPAESVVTEGSFFLRAEAARGRN
jgi:multidrug efflux pump subunit AcrA (membrane-fusion protein)